MNQHVQYVYSDIALQYTFKGDTDLLMRGTVDKKKKSRAQIMIYPWKWLKVDFRQPDRFPLVTAMKLETLYHT